MELLQLPREIPPIAPNIIFYVFGLPVSNSFLMGLVITLMLFALTFLARRFTVERESRIQAIFEYLYELMFSLVRQITGSNARTAGIFPVIGALFVYIAIANLIGLVPLLNEISYNGMQLFRSPTTEFNTTVGLAVSMVLLVQIVSMREIGIFAHAGKYFQVGSVIQGFRMGMRDGMIAIINFFIGLMDIISEMARVISLSFRLFGNLYAGTALMTVLLGTLAYGVPAIWFGISIFSSIIQAMVFGSLVTVFYSLALPTEKDAAKARRT